MLILGAKRELQDEDCYAICHDDEAAYLTRKLLGYVPATVPDPLWSGCSFSIRPSFPQ